MPPTCCKPSLACARRPGPEHHHSRRQPNQVPANSRRARCLPAGQRDQGGPGHRGAERKMKKVKGRMKNLISRALRAAVFSLQPSAFSLNNMLPHTQARKKRNSSKVNLLISFTVHALIVAGGALFRCARRIAGQTNSENFGGDGQGKTAREAQVARKTQGPPKEQPKIVAAPKVEPSKEAPPGGIPAHGRTAGGRTAVLCLRRRQDGGNQFRSRPVVQRIARIRLPFQDGTVPRTCTTTTTWRRCG